MKLEMRGQMRLEQQMKLAPHMIQSMEILQLPLLALQERIEQELNSNPVLEADETPEQEEATAEAAAEPTEPVVSKAETPEDYKGDDRMDEEVRDYIEHRDDYARNRPEGRGVRHGVCKTFGPIR